MGLWVDPSYRIDFALAHPDEPGRVVLAVEVDGDSYHRAVSARDRDRLRQQHLERLGWRFHRVWASAWFADPQRIIEAWEQAVQLSDTEPTAADIESVRSLPLFPSEAQPSLARPDVRPRLPIDGYTHAQLVAMFLWRSSGTVANARTPPASAIPEKTVLNTMDPPCSWGG
ncbi:hypothetical protein ACLMAL_38880 [Nocardia sp. CWNU-33]|uniref:hypothetical protein n=1 Tax=Nocardia sp. CWNU-33 TaxID=3392117 RepID=UPI00398E9E3D